MVTRHEEIRQMIQAGKEIIKEDKISEEVRQESILWILWEEGET